MTLYYTFIMPFLRELSVQFFVNQLSIGPLCVLWGLYQVRQKVSTKHFPPREKKDKRLRSELHTVTSFDILGIGDASHQLIFIST